MKGFNKLIGFFPEGNNKPSPGSEEEAKKVNIFQDAVNARIKVLLARLETVDSNITSLVSKKMTKKRSVRLYFTSLG